MTVKSPQSMNDSPRVALVTGGAKRVGRAIVEHLLTLNYDVAFTFFGSREAAEEMDRQYGSRVLAIRVDLTKPAAAVPFIAKKLEGQFDRLDLLINNASIYSPGDEQLAAMMAMHVETPLRLCRAFAERLKASDGKVINIVDLLADRPMPGYAAYCASKAALVNLTKSMARELSPQVVVNGIAPGVVAWPDDMPAADRRKYLKRVPLGRAGTPQDVAKLVEFLAGPSAYFAGAIFPLDGGRSIT